MGKGCNHHQAAMNWCDIIWGSIHYWINILNGMEMVIHHVQQSCFCLFKANYLLSTIGNHHWTNNFGEYVPFFLTTLSKSRTCYPHPLSESVQNPSPPKKYDFPPGSRDSNTWFDENIGLQCFNWIFMMISFCICLFTYIRSNNGDIQG